MSEQSPLGETIMKYLKNDITPADYLFSQSDNIYKNKLIFQDDQKYNHEYKNILVIQDGKKMYSIDDKSPEIIKFYEKAGIFKFCEEYVNLIKKTIDEKKMLLKSRQDDSIAILDLL